MGATLSEALRSAAAKLEGRSLSPGSDAEELLGRLLRLRRSDLYLQPGRALTALELETLASWIERRSAGEPVQYITGRAAFRDLDLGVGPPVLVPRPETEVLVERTLEVLRAERERWPEPRVLDLGTGSGAIALALATEWPAARVTATDSSPQALAIARTNARASGVAVRFLEGSWFDPVGGEERFEVVVSNPPYVAEAERGALPRDVREHEPREALHPGVSGLEALREIVDQAPRHLVAGGLIALEVPEARAEEVFAWLEGARDWERASLAEDLAGKPRVLTARRQGGPAIAPAQWPEEAGADPCP